MTNRPSRRIQAPGAALPFRIHFKDGTTEDVRATLSAEARECARPGEIDRVKIIRDTTPQREDVN